MLFRSSGKTPAPKTAPKPKEEPSWLERTAESAVETVKGAPAGLYQFGKEVLTQPAEAALAAGQGLAKTTGLYALPAAAAGVYEAGKAALKGEELIPALKRGYEEEKGAFMESAEASKQISPAAYGAGPYLGAAAMSAGAGLPAMLAAETATGAAQQLAETGKIDTAELAGQTVGGAVVGKIAESAPTVAKKLLPDTAAEKAAKLEQKAIKIGRAHV